MRSTRLLAGATAALILCSACGGDDGGTTPPTENEAPVASFTPPTNCVAGTACSFTSTSTDDVGVTTYTWDFDGAGTAPNGTTATSQFTFAAAGTYPVTLTVGDVEGLTNSVTHDVIVAAAPVNNVLPTASFEQTSDCVAGTPCGFHSTSTDPDGTITAEATVWNFGDLTATSTGLDVTHTFAAAGTYAVTVAVTDNAGGTATSAPQQITVTAAQSQDCTTSGTVVNCILTVSQRSTVTFTVVSTDCGFSGNRLAVTSPRAQTIFFNLCNRDPGENTTVTDAGGAPTVFEAGSQLAIQFVRGTPDATDPPASDPGIQVDGASPSWTLNIDDGGLAGTPNEPDFNDAVISVQATAAP
jgi:PKD repeat protein